MGTALRSLEDGTESAHDVAGKLADMNIKGFIMSVNSGPIGNYLRTNLPMYRFDVLRWHTVRVAYVPPGENRKVVTLMRLPRNTAAFLRAFDRGEFSSFIGVLDPSHSTLRLHVGKPYRPDVQYAGESQR